MRMFYDRLISGGVLIWLLSISVCSFANIKIVSITEDFSSIAKEIGQDKVSIISLVKGSRNLHNITPKPSMVYKLKSADMLIRLGMKQDSWIDGLIQVAKNPNVIPGSTGYIDASNGIEKLEVPTGKIDGRSGDVHIEGNPHYWLDPRNGIIIGETIKDRLISIDPKNESFYENNFNQFKNKIEKKYIGWLDQFKKINNQTVITYHKVWPYFFKAFGLSSIGELEPLPGIPPSAKHLSNLSSELKRSQNSILVLSTMYYPEGVGKSFAKHINGTYKNVSVNVGEYGISNYEELFDYLAKELTTY